MSYVSEWLVYLILRYNMFVGRGRRDCVMGGRENSGMPTRRFHP